MSQIPFEVITGSGVPTSHLPFSAGAQVGDLIFVSGQASVDETGTIINDTFEGEMRRSIENVKKVLAGAGLTLRDVVHTRNYIGSQKDLARYNEIYREYFEEPFPARMTLMECLGDLLKYEIEVIAVARKG
ncbi:MAG: RidA family protein [Candidatus Omnitrophica bacterium]|nr:RidA family protein [Candidatus Omnitrophota bacterium]